MSAVTSQMVSFRVQDAAGQKAATIRGCPADATIGEIVPSVMEMLELPLNDMAGQPASCSLRRDRDGALLLDSDLVGDVLDPENEVLILQPNVEAGGR